MFKKTSAPYPSMNNHIGQPIAVSEIKDIPLKKKSLVHSSIASESFLKTYTNTQQNFIMQNIKKTCIWIS